jgi:hypothetical protein
MVRRRLSGSRRLVQVDKGVTDAITSRLQVTLQIATPQPDVRLLGAAAEAVDVFVADWEDEPPPTEGGPFPPPLMSVSSVPPDVFVNLAEIADGQPSADRLLHELSLRLPETARVRLVKPRRPKRARIDETFNLLELRIALHAYEDKGRWKVTPEVAQRADEAARAWLVAAGSDVEIDLPLNGRALAPVDLHRLDETLAAERAKDYTSRLVARGTDGVRGVSFHHWGAHMSLVTGRATDDPAPYEKNSTLELLLGMLESLSDITKSAFVRFTSDPEETCDGAHMRRGLGRLPRRGPWSSQQERTHEERGLFVDAQGMLFPDTPPVGLPANWTVEPFGNHLYKVTAPQLDEWLTHEPSPETVAAGRSDLATLLNGPAN